MVTVAATAADIGAMDIVVALDSAINTDTAAPATVNTTTNVVTLGGVGHKTGITITVTPENNIPGDAYTITVYRESGPVLSNDATLEGGTGLSLTDWYCCCWYYCALGGSFRWCGRHVCI